MYPWDERTKKYMSEVHGIEFNEETPDIAAKQKAAEEAYNSQLDTSNTANLFSNIGDAIAGTKVGSNNEYFNNINKLSKENTIGEVEKTRKLVSDYLKEKYDRESKEKQAALLAGEKALDRRADKEKWQAMIDADKQEKAAKSKDMNAVQAKQLGLYKNGLLAEQQFNNALSNPEEYDPTSYADFIDNSSWAPNWMKDDKALEAQSAQNSWIESYLRDASGAAIPESERASYKKIYFPVPGDTKAVVANKAKLREQKMEAAKIGAGSAAENEMLATGKNEDDEALNWAMKNPQDPKAAKILQLNGIKVGGR